MKNDQIELVLPAEHRYLRLLAQATAILIEGTEPLEALGYSLDLATDELFSNLVDHAYDGQPGEVHIVLTLDRENHCFSARFTDYGRSFAEKVSSFPPAFWQRQLTAGGQRYLLNQVPEPEAEQTRGRGLFLMQALMDSVSCLVDDQGNHWELIKYYQPAPETQ